MSVWGICLVNSVWYCSKSMERGENYRWELHSGCEGWEGLTAALGVDGLVARVLAARGLVDRTEAAAFLSPKLSGLHEPGLMPGLARAAARVLRAIQQGEGIAIYGDYDADGVCATAVLHRVVRAVAFSIGSDVRVTGYIPHRLEEGYGLNADALRTLAGEHSVIVSVDCGVTARDAAAALEGSGVDLIITDHHNIDADQVPSCYAVVHPRLDWSMSGDDANNVGVGDDAYPFGELCGAGVAFKLAWRLGQIANGGDGARVAENVREALLDCLPLAALATIADIVPLVDENRIIAKHGLAMMGRSSVVGLDALLEVSGLDDAVKKGVDAEGAGFKLAPRLNAAGRLGHAQTALELFITDDRSRASELAEELSSENTERQRLERKFAEQALAKAEASGMAGADGRRAVVLWDADWHPGVIGIVCSRLVRSLGRPAVLCGLVDGKLKGSGRSIDGFNLHGALEACSEHLLTFGGHDMAAGVSLDPASFDAFAEAMMTYADEHIDDAMMVPALRVDVEASLGELTGGAVRALEGLGPFGRSNGKPRLLVRGLRAEQSGTMGAHAKHLQIRARGVDDGAGATVRLIGWSLGDLAERLPRGAQFDAVVTPKLNTFRGVTSVEAEVSDIALR